MKILLRARFIKFFVLTFALSLRAEDVTQDIAVPRNEPANWQHLAQGDTFKADQASEAFEAAVEAGSHDLIPRWLRWTPTGGAQAVFNPDCESFTLQNELFTKARTLPQYGSIVRNHFKRCEAVTSAKTPNAFMAVVKENAIRYEYFKNLPVQNIKLVGIDGSIYRARFIASRSRKPQPLVIAQCGIYCNLPTTSLSKLLMLLSDEAPFHVLLLGSVTGAEYQKENREFTVGGFDEGRKIFQWAKYVRSPDFPLANRVSSVHVVSYSHGSHSSLYASILNTQARAPSGGRYINSFFAGCAPMNLRSSSEYAYGRSLMGLIIYKLFKTQVLDILSFVPVVGDLVPGRRNFPHRDGVTDFVAKVSVENYKYWTKRPDWNFAPFQKTRVNNEEDFWEVNNFHHYSKLSDGPVFLWASTDDPVVNPEKNLTEFLKHVPSNSTAYQGLITPKGGHCNFETMYGWRTSGAMMRSYVVMNSPELLPRLHREQRTLAFQSKERPIGEVRRGIFSWGKKKPAVSGEARVGLEWRALPNEKYVELYSKVRTVRWVNSTFNGHDNSGRWEDYIEKRKSEIRIEDLRLPSSVQTELNNDESAARLTRWLNANLRVSGAQLGYLGPQEAPQRVDWMDWE